MSDHCEFIFRRRLSDGSTVYGCPHEISNEVLITFPPGYWAEEPPDQVIFDPFAFQTFIEPYKKARELEKLLREQLYEYQKKHRAWKDDEQLPLEHVTRNGQFVSIVTTTSRAMYLLSAAVSIDWADQWPNDGKVTIKNRMDLPTVSDLVYGEGEESLVQLTVEVP
jgi:hypothetical protein